MPPDVKVRTANNAVLISNNIINKPEILPANNGKTIIQNKTILKIEKILCMEDNNFP